jgi:F-type H+-transporting ATPase subunit delta
MAKVDDEQLALAGVYSRAMLELAVSSGEADTLLEELRELSVLAEENADFEAFLSSPTIDAEAREQSLEKLFRGKASDLLVNSLQILNRKERLGLVCAVAESYRLAHEELRGQIDVHVRTAVKLNDEQRQRIKEVAGWHAGKEAVLVEEVDESIIGGMVMRIGDRKYDSSVATELRQLGVALIERASREIHSRKEHVTESL